MIDWLQPPDPSAESIATRRSLKPRSGRRCWILALACLPMVAPAAPMAERSPASDIPEPGIVRARLPIQQNDGARISRVFFDLRGSTGDVESDRAIRTQLEALASISDGDSLNASGLLAVQPQLASLAGISEASVALFAGSLPGEVVVVIAARLATPTTPRESHDPLVLVATERALLRWQLGGSHGAFADHNPWFAAPDAFTSRSPIAESPPGRGWAPWAESALEYGLAGATQVGDAPATLFTEVTGVASASVGNDLFQSGPRYRNRIEKAYAGLAWVDRANNRSVKLSVGRQNWQLYGGFLFSRFAAGSNAGPNPGLYLSPRTTYQRAALLDARLGDLRFEAFDLNPSELEGFDSGSRYLGANLRHDDPARFEWGLTGYQVTESKARVSLSDGRTVPRKGVRVWAGRMGVRSLLELDGLDLLGEYAYQDSTAVPWSAQAWYAQIGYGFATLRGAPHLTYRRARFSGDDPGTPEQEAFDAPLSSGLDEWVQGVSFKKVLTNSNLDSHRVRLNIDLNAKTNWTFDYFRLDAHRVAPGARRHYGDEVNAALRWSLTPRLFFLGVAGVAWPGEEMRRRAGGIDRPWATVQASIYWGL